MNIAIILAGGYGSRFLNESNKFPKQFYEFCRKEVIAYSLETFNKHPQIDKIVVVSNFEYIKKTEEIVKKYNFDKVIGVVSGGVTRQASVYSAIEFLSQDSSYGNPNVLIHDAARLLVSKQVISANIKALEDSKAVSTILPCTDSMILSENGETITESLDRNKIYVVQTPQSFKLDLLRSAHKFAQTLNIYDSTDDASLMKLLNEKVKLVPGNKANMKLTTEEDLIFIKAIFENLQSKEEE